MAAETNVITTDEMARVRTLDFVYQFTGNLNKLAEVLGITRKIAVEEGTTIKGLKVIGELESGAVDEGDIIPLSQYETQEVPLGEITLGKWRKATTGEAILKGGYDQAVTRTNEKMIKDVQKTIRTDLFTYLATGTGAASGVGLQAALANAWGQLQVKFEDDAVEPVYILNPLDVSDYLGTAQVTMQTAFGMTYIENFLGLGTVFLNSGVEQGTFIATVKDNVVLYYVNAGSGDFGEVFDFTTDELGLVGITEQTTKERLQAETVVVCGVDFFPEYLDGIIVGEIESAENP